MRRVILGVDPGPTHSALVVMEEDYRVRSAVKAENEKIRTELGFGWDERDLRPTAAIECLQSYGAPVGRETFETAYWIGRFLETLYRADIQAHLYPRPKIFRALTGCAKGGDAALRQALLLRFGGDRKGEPLHALKGDGSDKRSAFAVAVYHADGARLGGW